MTLVALANNANRRELENEPVRRFAVVAVVYGRRKSDNRMRIVFDGRAGPIPRQEEPQPVCDDYLSRIEPQLANSRIAQLYPKSTKEQVANARAHYTRASFNTCMNFLRSCVSYDGSDGSYIAKRMKDLAAGSDDDDDDDYEDEKNGGGGGGGGGSGGGGATGGAYGYRIPKEPVRHRGGGDEDDYEDDDD